MKRTATRNVASRKSSARQRERASAVILVVVSLVLMALIGAAYLQQTRVQRFATAPPRGDMNLVIDAILSQIQDTLRDDLRYNPDNPEALELYDYPWTNQDDQNDDNIFTALGWEGAEEGDALGGYQDDMWLASSEPIDLDAANPRWPHITNLSGLFLRYEANNNRFTTNTVDGVAIPVPDVVDFTNAQNNSDSLLDIWNNMNLVDVSGDGVPDSRWAWAPIQEMDDIAYVMAVRIVDLSAKLNLNSAMTLLNIGSGNLDQANWEHPSELDLSTFVFNRRANNDIADELQRQVRYRFDDDTQVTWPVAAGARRSYWRDQGRYSVTNDHRRYGLANEYELRHRDGLNSGRPSPVPLVRAADGMPEFLRNGDEGYAERFYDHTTPDGWDASVYTDYPGGIDDTNPLQMFYEAEPRKQLTTLSGASIFRWPMVDEAFGFNVGDQTHDDITSYYKVDLNNSSRQNVQRAFEEVYRGYRNSGDPPLIDRMPEMLPGGFGQTDDDLRMAAAQFAANVATYRSDVPFMIEVEPRRDDPDNDPEVLPRRYGVPPLPVITEVYTQAKYKAESILDTPADPGGDPDVPYNIWEIRWDQEGDTGYAIEIRNPFDEPVALYTIQLWIDGEPVRKDQDANSPADWEDWENSQVMLSHLAAAPGEDERRYLDVGEVLVLYRHSDVGANWTSQYDPPHNAQDYHWEETPPHASPADPPDPLQWRIGVEGDDWRDNLLEHISGTDGTIIPVKIPDHVPAWPSVTSVDTTLRDVEIELRGVIRWDDVDDDDNDYLYELAPWPYFEMTAYRFPTERVVTDLERETDPVSGEPIAYWQHSVRGGGEGLNPLVFRDQDMFDEDYFEPVWVPGDPNDPEETEVVPEMQPDPNGDDPPVERNEYESRLGHLEKDGVDYDETLDDHLLYRDRGQFRSIGDLVNLMVIGPSAFETTPGDWDHSTFAEQWHDAMEFARNNTPSITVSTTDYSDFEKVFKLNFDPALGVIGDPNVPEENNLLVTHAAMMIDRFTTLSPVAAGLSFQEGGAMVPGLVNLNTMPQHLLEQVLPLQQQAQREDIAEWIVTYREGTAANRRNLILSQSGRDVEVDQLRENPGIGNIGELFLLLEDDDEDLSQADRMELARWLSQVGSARSDYFAAYIYVRAYDLQEDGFAVAPEVGIADAARVIAVFERNARDGQVRVRAVLPGARPYTVR
ncbi:hypothetical protein ACERK3_14590 [Phycisphaerales bacterium AB-hyl4]|uniref:Uncharacterized protein n=1 Tax=Natronomicrosphaera hydrolytica TaxID=3242702 RepID=A0ABV4UAD5_9BACT